LKRRAVLTAIVSLIATALAGCGAIEGARSRITGHVSDPRSIILKNRIDDSLSIDLTVHDDAGNLEFNDQFTVEPHSSVTAWETTRVGRYQIAIETSNGLTTSGEMKVCVGYHDLSIAVSSGYIASGQRHGEGVDELCSLG